MIRQEGKILFLKDSRNLMLNQWSFPHGRCEATDKLEEKTVIREVFEETCLKVKPIKKLWTTTADTKIKTVSFWMAEVIEGQIKIDPAESSEYGWFTIDEALKLELYPGTEKFLELVEKGEITT